MKKILAIILTSVLLLSTVPAFAAGNMSSWFTSSTAQTLQIIDAEENLMAYDKRINPMMTLYGIYDMLGEADVDISKVEAPFTDINSFQPYSNERKAVTWLYLKGVVKGYDDGSVKPNQEVSRAEFVALLVRMLENTNSSIRVSTGTTNPYDDIAGHWAYDSILKATNMGLVQGDGKTFNPNNMITKEEVITIGLRLADKMELDINDFADVIDEIYDITIDYPIYTNGYGDYDYSQYDYVINVDDYENIYFDGVNSISSYTTSKTGVVSISKYSSYLKVTGKKEGVVTLNAKGTNGYQRSVKVLVVDKYASKDSYTVRVNSTQKIYHPDRTSIRSYTVTSGSSYISVTKYNNYLSVKGKKAGTAKIKIVNTYGVAETVTVRVTSSSSSSTSYYDDYYEIEVGDYENVYTISGDNIKSYSIVSGSSHIAISKYSSYLRIYGRNEGTARVKITDTYGYSYTVTIDVLDDGYGYEGYAYGLTDEYDLEKGEYANIYFNYIDDIDDYKLSKTGIVTVTKYNGYLRVYAKTKGTVSITAYDDYSNSERIRINVENDDYYYDDGYDYGITDTISMDNDNREKIYFSYLEGDIEDYDVSISDIVTVDLRDGYIIIEGRNGKSGTVIITVWDEYGNSEAVKVKVYTADNGYDDESEPPYRDVIYPPDYEVDISK